MPEYYNQKRQMTCTEMNGKQQKKAKDKSI